LPRLGSRPKFGGMRKTNEGTTRALVGEWQRGVGNTGGVRAWVDHIGDF